MLTSRIRRKLWLFVILFLPVFLLAGCAAINLNRQVAKFQRPTECVRFFELLDRTVEKVDVRDASVFVVKGFPYLRTSRFLSGLKEDLKTEARKEQWLRRLQQLDLEARRKEIQNLPAVALKDLTDRLGEPSDRQMLLKRAAFYSEKMLLHDQNNPDFYNVLLQAVTEPSEYSSAMRVVGMYPLAAIPVISVTRNVQAKFSKWHRARSGAIDIQGVLTAYTPGVVTEYSEQTVRHILDRSRQNALLVPLPSIAEQDILLAMFAPVIKQDVAADYDNVGEVTWQDSNVCINPTRPTVYHYFSHALLKGVPVLQLNYVFWYPARNGPKSPWIERGPVDGITLRVSLDHDGRPFMVDIMNNCGCYHFFVPHPEKVGNMIPSPDGIDAFVPRRLPENYPEKRLKLRIISGWHQVAHIDDQMNAARHLDYRLSAYEKLEMLPHDDQYFESIFNSAGIGKGSGRIEPLIFFSMGIADIGSMRQRGHHAVKLVGWEHFDDPDLFDRNFEIE